MTNRSSRLPYVLAGVVLLLVVGMAWINRNRVQPVMAGYAAPEFRASDLEGNPKGLEDYAGQVVLLNVWATWCLPCREEMPSMQRLYDEYRGSDFEIVAVSIDARLGETDGSGHPGGNVGAFADSLDLTFPILHDPSGRIQQTYQTTGVPESFVIGRDGMIYRRVTGATEWDTRSSRELVDRLLAMDGGGSASES